MMVSLLSLGGVRLAGVLFSPLSVLSLLVPVGSLSGIPSLIVFLVLRRLTRAFGYQLG